MENGSGAATLYVIVPPSRLFAAHWSFFIPNAVPRDSPRETGEGRRIHVTGDRLNGFALEIIRQYDISKHRNVSDRRYPIGIIESRAAEDKKDALVSCTGECKDEDEGGGYVDNTPVDNFELACTLVEPPGPSLNRISDSDGDMTGRGQKAEVRDCQWWVRQVVGKSLQDGTLKPLMMNGKESSDPETLVAGLPVH